MKPIGPDDDPWFLPTDFPVVIDKAGIVRARFGDSIWELDCEHRAPMCLNFGDGVLAANLSPINSANAFVLRRLAAWWLHGARRYENPATLLTYFLALRPIFTFCTREGIVADQLSRYPDLIDKLGAAIAPSKANDVLMLLHIIFEATRELGFTILDNHALKKFSQVLPEHQRRQTAYIPPRIWTYQVVRLKSFLDDFWRHRNEIQACFEYCFEVYSLQKRSLPAGQWRAPFSIAAPGHRSMYLGRYSETANQFGILELLEKWAGTSSKTGTVSNFSSYLTAASGVSAAFIANMSLMRISEVWDLRRGCLIIEDDEVFGPTFTLSGRASKGSIDDDGDARWITSPSVELAVEVAHLVSKLRASIAPPELRSQQECRAERLFVGSCEPWTRRQPKLNLDKPRAYPSYQGLLSQHPKLLDINELRITDDDLNVANLINPDLDRMAFAVGKVWPLAWHQLRRTGAVNMQASGLVSEPAMQYQLKHVSRSMSIYYGRGYGKLKLHREAASTYVRTMYESIGAKFAELAEDCFVSPHGQERKLEIINCFSEKDHRALTAAATSGEVAYRETLFGGCTKRGTCPYGGIDNVIRCGGGDGKEPCADAVFDRRKLPQLIELRAAIQQRLDDSVPSSPRHTSLLAQMTSVERTLNVLRQD